MEQTQHDIEMKLYALYLKDLQTMGTRHEHVRKYYLTLISAIFVILSLGGSTLAFTVTPGLVWLVSAFGAVLCMLWFLHMQSYGTLFKAKFSVLENMEKQLPYKPYTWEKSAMEEPETKHRPTSKFDMWAAAIFLALFIVLPFLPRVAPVATH